jgi:hypothetical protein
MIIVKLTTGVRVEPRLIKPIFILSGYERLITRGAPWPDRPGRLSLFRMAADERALSSAFSIS